MAIEEGIRGVRNKNATPVATSTPLPPSTLGHLWRLCSGWAVIIALGAVAGIAKQFWVSQVATLLGQFGSVVLVTGVCVILMLIWAGYILEWPWMGLVPQSHLLSKPGQDKQASKTFWDWLQLLVVPLVLVVGGFWFQHQQQMDNTATTVDQAQESLLNTYIDRMSDLLLDPIHPLAKSRPNDVSRTIARARTLETVSRLDSNRKGQLLQFLFETTLITKTGSLAVIVSLAGADLIGASLDGANLSPAILSGTHLDGAHLSGANLTGANLTRTILTKATMTNGKVHN